MGPYGAAQAGISRVLAAFHLDKLVAGGLLRASYARLSGRTGPGAGRPAKLYSRVGLDEAVSLPARRYDVAAGTLAYGLARLAEQVGDDAVSSAVNEPARERERATGRAARRKAGSCPGSRRARNALVETLAEAGYEPIVDERAGTVTLANCPFHELSESHRSLTCSMNSAWAEGLVVEAGSSDLTAHLEPEPGRCCVVFRPDASQQHHLPVPTPPAAAPGVHDGSRHTRHAGRRECAALACRREIDIEVAHSVFRRCAEP